MVHSLHVATTWNLASASVGTCRPAVVADHCTSAWQTSTTGDRHRGKVASLSDPRPSLPLRPPFARFGLLNALRAWVACLHGVDVRLWASDVGRLPRDQRHVEEARLVPGLSWDGPRPVRADGLPISLAHDAEHLLVATGVSGCDIEPVSTRDWDSLLGPARSLLAELRRGGDAPNLAGARVWSAREALFKAGATRGEPELVRRDDEMVEFALGDLRVSVATPK